MKNISLRLLLITLFRRPSGGKRVRDKWSNMRSSLASRASLPRLSNSSNLSLRR